MIKLSNIYTKLYIYVISKILHNSGKITVKNVNFTTPFYIKCSRTGIINLSNNVRARHGLYLNVTDHGKLYIDNNCFFNRNCSIHCHNEIKIGENTIFGENVQIYDHDHKFNTTTTGIQNGYVTAPIHIGKNCWIGANVTILKGSIIGDNCLIAAGSIVKGIIPNNSLMYNKSESIIIPNYKNI